MPSEPPLDTSQPTGTVTLVFTDIEGSTGLLQALGDRYPEVLADRHDRLVREAFGRHGAVERARRVTDSTSSSTGRGPRCRPR